MPRRLKYVGAGEYLPGVPAADHTAASEKQAAELVAGGLYEYADGNADEEPEAEPPEEEE